MKKIQILVLPSFLLNSISPSLLQAWEVRKSNLLQEYLANEFRTTFEEGDVQYHVVPKKETSDGQPVFPSDIEAELKKLKKGEILPLTKILDLLHTTKWDGIIIYSALGEKFVITELFVPFSGE